MIANVTSGSMATQDLTALRQKRFSKIDQDGDGKITKDELQAARPQNGKGPSVDDIFSKVDTNQDGAIDEGEDKVAFEAMVKHGHHHHGGAPDPTKLAETLFKKADADSSGSITKDELTQALSSKNDKSSKIDDLFKAADTDGDGSISQSDLETALKKMFEEMQAKHAAGSASGNYNQSGCKQTGTTESSQFSAVA